VVNDFEIMQKGYGHMLCYFLNFFAVLKEMDLTVVSLISFSFSDHYICTYLILDPCVSRC
jgi:nitrogen fixation protein FixH